ncbi:MAG: hypothetical protein ACLU4J_17445 [Butyricimonas paravirosa]
MCFSLRYEDSGRYLRSNSANQYSIYLKNELKLADWFTLTYGSNVYLTKTEVSQSGVSWLDAMPYERVVSDEGDPVYQYKVNYYRAMDINETEGLEFMGYNLKEEMYKNMLTTKSVYDVCLRMPISNIQRIGFRSKIPV